MFGMSGTEIAIILILALLLLGPTKLPELARQMGKGLRDLRRSTDDIRRSVESEFYRMDQPPRPPPPAGQVASGESPAAPPPKLAQAEPPAPAETTSTRPAADAPAEPPGTAPPRTDGPRGEG